MKTKVLGKAGTPIHKVPQLMTYTFTKLVSTKMWEKSVQTDSITRGNKIVGKPSTNRFRKSQGLSHRISHTKTAEENLTDSTKLVVFQFIKSLRWRRAHFARPSQWTRQYLKRFKRTELWEKPVQMDSIIRGNKIVGKVSTNRFTKSQSSLRRFSESKTVK